MKCKIVSQQTKQEFQNIISVTLPGLKGEMQVLPGHAEGLINLQGGEIVLKNNKNEETHLPLPNNSVCHIHNNEVLIIS